MAKNKARTYAYEVWVPHAHLKKMAAQTPRYEEDSALEAVKGWWRGKAGGVEWQESLQITTHLRTILTVERMVEAFRSEDASILYMDRVGAEEGPGDDPRTDNMVALLVSPEVMTASRKKNRELAGQKHPIGLERFRRNVLRFLVLEAYGLVGKPS